MTLTIKKILFTIKQLWSSNIKLYILYLTYKILTELYDMTMTFDPKKIDSILEYCSSENILIYLI